MKKEYIIPEMEVVELKTLHSILIVSGLQDGEEIDDQKLIY